MSETPILGLREGRAHGLEVRHVEVPVEGASRVSWRFMGSYKHMVCRITFFLFLGDLSTLLVTTHEPPSRVCR